MLTSYATKYRPQTLDEMVLPERIRKIFPDTNLPQNYLFHSGPPGMGKTTLCRILSKDYDTLEIPASEDGTIETIRNKVREFASSGSIMGGTYLRKLIFFDEIDGASSKFFQAFRSVAEDENLAPNMTFLATCNDFNSIPDAVKSRFMCIDFLPENKAEETEVKKGYAKYIHNIASKNGINMSGSIIKTFVNKSFPDLRSMMNTLQLLETKGITNPTISDIDSAIYSYSDVYEACFDKNLGPLDIYKKFSKKYASMANDVVDSLWKGFIKWSDENNKNITISQVGMLLRDISDHKSKKGLVDPVLNMLSCIYTIHDIINGE